MNNPGIDLEIWENLRKKWADLNSRGHKVSIEFRLVSHPADRKNILAIDVVQRINDDIVVETIQKKAGEAYMPMGIHGLSIEQLKDAYQSIASEDAGQRDADLIVTMTPTSPTSGALHGVLEKHNSDIQNSVAVNYRHYYVLNALREKMIEQRGENWSR